VRTGHIYEVKSTYILQPGPAALKEGVRHLQLAVAVAAGSAVRPELMPTEPLDPDLDAAWRRRMA
jgi:hypothetical protein